MKTFIELPEAGTRVQLHLKKENSDSFGHDGIWNGREWLMRKVYTKDEFEPIPEDLELIAVEPLKREPYSK